MDDSAQSVLTPFPGSEGSDEHASTAEPDYAPQRSSHALAEEMLDRVDRVRQTWRQTFLASRMRRNWHMYYGLDDGQAHLDDNLYAAGPDGAFVKLRANHFRNIVQHMHVMTTNTRPVIDCKASNTDEKSIKQAQIANHVIEHYFELEDIYRYIDRAVESALVITAGFIHVEWDPSLGDAYDVKDTGDQSPTVEDLIFKGDLTFSNPTLFDVTYDQAAGHFEEVNDITVRSWRNKYDLIARYPDLAENLKAEHTKSPFNTKSVELPTLFFETNETDLIEVFTYYHKRTAAMPKGRMTIFTASGTVLYDDDLPYARIPLFRVAAADMINTPHGFSPATDIAPLQEAVDRLGSSIFTNLSTFGVQSVLIPRGANIQIDQIDSGLNAVLYNETGGPDGGKPTPLQLTKSPPEAFKFLEMLVHYMEDISGVNSVARGNPPPGMDAGVALSLVQTMAIQFMSQLQKSYAQLLRDVATFIIDTLKVYAQAPRIINIVGHAQASSVKEFVGADLEGVARVTVDLGNPMSRTVAGRMQIAKALIDSGMALNPEQYLQVLASGRLDPMTESADAQLNLVRSENERLMAGIPCQVVAGDDDQMHIKEHLTLLSNPDVRDNGQYVQGVLEHIGQHQNKYMQGDLIRGIVSGMIQPGSAQHPQAPPGQQTPPQGHAPPAPQGAKPPPHRRPPSSKEAPGILPQPQFPAPPPAPPAQ